MTESLKERDERIKQMVAIVEELEQKLAAMERERNSLAKSLESAEATMDARTKTVSELQRATEDMQMVNSKLKSILGERTKTIDDERRKGEEMLAESQKQAKRRESEMEMKYMERERELKQEMKTTIAKLKSSVSDILSDSDKVCIRNNPRP